MRTMKTLILHLPEQHFGAAACPLSSEGGQQHEKAKPPQKQYWCIMGAFCLREAFARPSRGFAGKARSLEKYSHLLTTSRKSMSCSQRTTPSMVSSWSHDLVNGLILFIHVYLMTYYGKPTPSDSLREEPSQKQSCLIYRCLRLWLRAASRTSKTQEKCFRGKSWNSTPY